MQILGYRLPELTALGALVGLVCGPLVTRFCLQRTMIPVRSVAAGLTALMLPMVLSVTLAPSGADFGSGCALILPSIPPSFSHELRLLNVLLFLPLGFLLMIVGTNIRHRITAVVLLVILSTAIELLQSTDFITRSCDLTDVVDNSVGSIVGASAGTLLAIKLPWRDHHNARSGHLAR